MKNIFIISIIFFLLLFGPANTTGSRAAAAGNPAAQGHKDDICVVRFSPDGKLLASGSEDMTIKIWEVKSGRLLLTLKGHKDDINYLEFSPDGKSLVSGSCDQTVRIWDLKDGSTIRIIGIMQ